MNIKNLSQEEAQNLVYLLENEEVDSFNMLALDIRKTFNMQTRHQEREAVEDMRRKLGSSLQ